MDGIVPTEVSDSNDSGPASFRQQKSVHQSTAYTPLNEITDRTGIRRTKKFHVFGELFENGERYPLPWLPPKEMLFDLFFYRQLFENVVCHEEHGNGEDMHIVVIRNISTKLWDMSGLDATHGDFEVPWFGMGGQGGKTAKSWFSWKDVCEELTSVGHPEIMLTVSERLYLLLADFDSSRLALVWFYFDSFVNLATLSSIIVPEFPIYCIGWLWPHVDKELAHEAFKEFCMYFFTFEYCAKLVPVFFIRMELCDPDLLLAEVQEINSHKATALNMKQRLAYFVLKSDNLVDLITIIPFWLQVCVGNLLPSTSFLRMFRIARVFRIVKGLKSMDMVQVLGMTLWKSIGITAILFFLVALIGLMCACLLQQLEASADAENFETVPHAWYWVFVRLISMKHVAYASDTVTSPGGIATFAVTMAVKTIMLIMPMARIKQIYVEEHNAVITVGKLRKSMERALQKDAACNDWSCKQGSACAHIKLAAPPTRPDGSGMQEGVIKALIPLPIMHTRTVEVPDMEVFLDMPTVGKLCRNILAALSYGYVEPPIQPSLTVALDWRPSPKMQSKGDDPALPMGALRIEVLRANGFPANSNWNLRLEVPDTLFSLTIREMEMEVKQETLSRNGEVVTEIRKIYRDGETSLGSETHFDISWKVGEVQNMDLASVRERSPRTERQKPLSAELRASSPVPVDGSDNNMSAVMALLREQSTLMRQQHLMLDEQSKKLDEQSRRIAQLEKSMMSGATANINPQFKN